MQAVKNFFVGQRRTAKKNRLNTTECDKKKKTKKRIRSEVYDTIMESNLERKKKKEKKIYNAGKRKRFPEVATAEKTKKDEKGGKNEMRQK